MSRRAVSIVAVAVLLMALAVGAFVVVQRSTGEPNTPVGAALAWYDATNRSDHQGVLALLTPELRKKWDQPARSVLDYPRGPVRTFSKVVTTYSNVHCALDLRFGSSASVECKARVDNSAPVSGTEDKGPFIEFSVSKATSGTWLIASVDPGW